MTGVRGTLPGAAGQHRPRPVVGRRPFVVFLPAIQGGGLDRSTFSLVEGLRERGVDARLLLSTEDRPTGADVPRGVPADVLGARRGRALLGPLRAWIRDRRPGHIHAVAPVPLLAATAAATTMPDAPTVSGGVHNLLAQELSFRTSLPHRLVVGAAMRSAYRSANPLVAISPGLAGHVASRLGMPPGRVDVISPPIMHRLHGYEPGDPPHPLLAPGGPPTVVTVGRLHRQKDVPTLLRAMRRLRTMVSDAAAFVLGDGPDRAALEAQAAELGVDDRVHFVGHRRDRFDWMRHASVYVQTSRYEGLGGSLVEALAVGACVVATDAPHGPADVLSHGRFGDLVPVGDDRALADMLALRLRDPRTPDLGDHLDQYRLGPVADAWASLLSLESAS